MKNPDKVEGYDKNKLIVAGQQNVKKGEKEILAKVNKQPKDIPVLPEKKK